MPRPFDLTDPQEVAERTAKARAGMKVGARIGGLLPHPAGRVVGATLGGISGFILGDQETVFPIDMIAIPAYQAYMLSGTPAFQIYIKEGEVLTQVQMTDAQEATEELLEAAPTKKKRVRKKSKYHTSYGKHFKAIQANYKLKNGKWKKNGFKRCAAAARKLAKGGK